MRTKWCIWVVALVFGAICSASQRGAADSAPGGAFLGTWAGTWDGAGSGGFELTLEHDKEGRLGGRVSVTGEPAYQTTLRTVSFDGARMTARYDFPAEEAIEILLAATFEGETAKGTWLARLKANGDEVASGTWAVTRK